MFIFLNKYNLFKGFMKYIFRCSFFERECTYGNRGLSMNYNSRFEFWSVFNRIPQTWSSNNNKSACFCTRFDLPTCGYDEHPYCACVSLPRYLCLTDCIPDAMRIFDWISQLSIQHACFILRRTWVWISARRQAILPDVFVVFLSSSPESMFKVVRGPFLSHHF
jgi:hypothetical protein